MSDKVSVDNKLKRKMEEPPSTGTNLEESLTLRIGNTSKCLEISEGLGNSFKEKMQQYQFACRYCDTKYPTARSLGAHQKAHRREKAERARSNSETLYPFGRMHNKSSSPLRVGSYANHKLHLPNTSFTAPHQLQYRMNVTLGGGVAGIKERLNCVVDLQELNQVPSFVESGADKSFQGSLSLGGLEGNTSVPSKNSVSEELDLSLTLRPFRH